MALAKNALLALVSLVVFLGAIEGVLALVGVEPALYERDPMVGFSAQIPLYVPANRRGLVHTAPNKRAIFNLQRFRRVKPDGTYRIFCMGGSTTYGRPYADATSFCGWLRAMLPVADPSRNWELINAGGISYASYRVAALTEELVAYDPDLFIVYTGHNEFLERRTYGSLLDASPWVLGARAMLNRTRTYTVMTGAIESLTGRRAGELMQRDVLPGEVDAVLDDSVGLQAYERDDELSHAVMAHYRINLERMVDIARRAGAATVFVTPASNLRSCSPFKNQSLAELAEPERAAFRDWLDKARKRYDRRRPARALEAVDEALAIDPRYPEAHYLRGRILVALDRDEDAARAFQRAVDEDVCPLRAQSATVQIVRDVARDRGVPLVDWVARLDVIAAHGIPGEDLFLDHVHPSVDANRLLALDLVAALRDAAVLRADAELSEADVARVREAVEGQLDDRAHARALTNLAKVFGWAGKHEEAHELALRALETVDDVETYNNAAMNALRLGRIDEAIGFYEKVIERKPRHVPALSDLGFALAQQERYDEALPHLEKAVALDPGYERARFNHGHVLAALGRYDEAIAELGQAIRLNPARAEYVMVLANVYAESGASGRAIPLYDRALEMKPGLSKAHYRLAVLLLESGRLAEAAEHFRAAVELAPGSPIALTQLAWILASAEAPELRDAGQAIRYAEAACELTDYEDADALDALGAAYAEAGRFEEAARLGRRAIAAARAGGETDAIAALETRVALYEAGKPYRAGSAIP